jgi:hypothetical protein
MGLLTSGGILTSGGTRCGEKKPRQKGSKVVPLFLFSKFPTKCTHNKSKKFDPIHDVPNGLP